jgi:hypothetical protein
MKPAVKFTLGRLVLFLVCAFLAFGLLPRDVNDFLKLLVALLVSLPLSYFLLRTWREQMAEQIISGQARRSEEKKRLRAALAGEDEDAATDSRP